MKRSEILRELYLMLHSSPDYPSEEDILSLIEECGMLPPFDTSVDYGHEAKLSDYRWEAEDE